MKRMKKMNDPYAPIVIFLYCRPDKTAALFDSLIKNPLSSMSDVYVFSDGPKNEKAREGVEAVREYLADPSLAGHFKSFTVDKAASNRGLAASVIDGVGRVIEEYERAIVLEDDLTVSPVFLDYMNSCLDHYKKDKRIFSISGYSPYLPSSSGYDKNVYLSYRASSWGWATWKDRWVMVDWSVSDYAAFKYDPAANRRFMRGGNDLPSMLRAQMKGKIDSWAVRFCYCQSRNDMLSVAPVRSLVSNSGFDGTGTNCLPGDESGFGRVNTDDEIREWCYDDLNTDPALTGDFYRYYHISIPVRIRDKVRELSGKGKKR